MPISTRTLVQIAAWGGLVVSSTGFYLQRRLIDKIRDNDYYKNAIKALRMHAGAVHYLGEPIKDKRFKITDTVNNYSDEKNGRFCVPVSGPKERGSYYFWAEKITDEWKITRAELELKSKPDTRLVVIKICEMFVGTSKEKFLYHNTLLCLVKALQDQIITLDFRNDSYVCGEVTTVDGFMNISFSNAVYCDSQGNEFFFEYLFVHARNIRYIHVPETTSVLKTIRNELNRNKNGEPVKKPREKSRKTKKAILQHMQTVADLDM